MNTSKPGGGENLSTKETPMGKTQVQKENPLKQRKGNPRASRQGDQRDHTTESHRTPTIEVHPKNTAGKAEHWELQKQTKRIT